MKMNPFSGTFLVASLLFLSTSCKKEIKNETADQDLSSQSLKQSGNPSDIAAKKSSDEELLKDVKKATSRFHSTTQAIKAGYIPDDHCVSVPGLGGMGFHWANPTLVDGVFDPLQPEAVLYAPGPDGNLRLVALEYIVMNQGQPRPMFGSQPFDINGVPGLPPHWSLHVWLYENNPAGMFTPFNPNVSCD